MTSKRLLWSLVVLIFASWFAYWLTDAWDFVPYSFCVAGALLLWHVIASPKSVLTDSCKLIFKISACIYLGYIGIQHLIKKEVPAAMNVAGPVACQIGGPHNRQCSYTPMPTQPIQPY